MREINQVEYFNSVLSYMRDNNLHSIPINFEYGKPLFDIPPLSAEKYPQHKSINLKYVDVSPFIDLHFIFYRLSAMDLVHIIRYIWHFVVEKDNRLNDRDLNELSNYVRKKFTCLINDDDGEYLNIAIDFLLNVVLNIDIDSVVSNDSEDEFNYTVCPNYDFKSRFYRCLENERFSFMKDGDGLYRMTEQSKEKTMNDILRYYDENEYEINEWLGVNRDTVHGYDYDQLLNFYGRVDDFVHNKRHRFKKSIKKGRLSNKKKIEMINYDTDERYDVFYYRDDIIEQVGIKKSHLSQCIKSVRDNIDDRSKWKKFLYLDDRYYFKETDEDAAME